MQMFIEMLRKDKKTIALYLLLIFVIISFVFLLITLYMQTNANMLEKSKAEISEQALVNLEGTIIADKVGGLVGDVLFIADSMLLEDTRDYTDDSVLMRLWISFSNREKIYDQIRYLDTDGNEVIRINNISGSAAAVGQAALQNKKDRYYFQDTMILEKGQIFISKLDLNVENGVLEQPIKPMLRLGTPVFSSGGDLEGVIILNYAANDVLGEIGDVAATSQGDVFLLNSDGYWLYNSADSSKEWAFMMKDRSDISFANEYPDAWEIIAGSQSGYFTTGNGVFIYESLTPSTAIRSSYGDIFVLCRSGPLYIVSHIALDSAAGELFAIDLAHLLPAVLAKYAFVYLLIAVIALALAVVLVLNKSQIKKIRYYSEFDTMTGVYNRRAGYGKLNALRKDVTKKDCRIAICFIDINGLKEVNDLLGHDAGDELIQSVVWVIKDSVRGNDFIARLGGDEFLIVFEGLDTEGAEKVWKRILLKYDQINADEGRKYVVSVSHGVGMFRCGENESVDTVVNRADVEMYREKREMKKGLQVIRESE